jgi:hypothetical protein
MALFGLLWGFGLWIRSSGTLTKGLRSVGICL